MTEPEELLATREEPRREVDNEPLLVEPKEEPLDISIGKELSYMGDKDYKKEEMPDYDYMLSYDGVANKSEEAEFSSLIHVEPKLEVLEDRVVIAVENPNGLKFCDDSNKEATLEDNHIRPRRRSSKDEELASSSGLPVSAQDIVEMSLLDLKLWLKWESLSESQREVIWDIRKRGNQRIHQSIQRRKKEIEIRGCEDNRVDQELINNSIATPQCIFCKKYPSTAYAYIHHLYKQHRTSLKLNEIYLLCSCGTAIFSTDRNAHNEKCAGIEFTLHKVEENSWYSSPKCIICKIHPSTLYAYISHLNDRHKSTLQSNQVYLLCSCGAEVHSKCHASEHAKMCAGIEFSVLNAEKAIRTTPQCIFCEKYPQSAYSYSHHLARYHRTTLNANQIYLLCSCGEQVRSGNRSLNHPNECDASQFSIEREYLGELVDRIVRCVSSDHCYSLPPSH